MEENGNQITNDVVLDEFRNQWQQELEGGGSTNNEEISQEERAKVLFQQGVDFERKGKCYEAIRMYRKAIQLVPDIEFKMYSQTVQQKKNRADLKNNNISNDPKPGSSRQSEIDQAIEDLVESFQKDLALEGRGVCETTFEAGTISTSLHISCLPVEVFLVILKWLVSSDLDFKSLERFGQVCKGFYLLSRDQEVWKLACMKIWGPNISPTTTWREMLLTRPRVNFNGCYISKINYQRFGENPGFVDQFYRPVQIIEYFRVVRFLPNGKLLMLTSADELQLSVSKLKNVRNAFQSRDILKGEYHYQDSTVLIVIKKKPSAHQKYHRKISSDDEVTFFLELEIQDTLKKKFTKLNWKHYTISHFRNGEELNSDFDLRSSSKYPPFYFSQVKSYHSESTDCLKV